MTTEDTAATTAAAITAVAIAIAAVVAATNFTDLKVFYDR